MSFLVFTGLFMSDQTRSDAEKKPLFTDNQEIPLSPLFPTLDFRLCILWLWFVFLLSPLFPTVDSPLCILWLWNAHSLMLWFVCLLILFSRGGFLFISCGCDLFVCYYPFSFTLDSGLRLWFVNLSLLY